MSKRAAIAKYGVGWHTLKKMLAHDEPPGYRQAKHRPKPKPFLPVIRQILEDDGKAPTKQKHTARRIFERVRSPQPHLNPLIASAGGLFPSAREAVHGTWSGSEEAGRVAAAAIAI